MHKSLVFLRFLKDVGFLEASLTVSGASWSRLGAVLRPCGASWELSCGILGYLEPSRSSSWALRRALGAVLGHLETLQLPADPPRPGSGDG
eukprot:7654663-Pyramimonas_sp.AAC.1